MEITTTAKARPGARHGLAYTLLFVSPMLLLAACGGRDGNSGSGGGSVQGASSGGLVSGPQVAGSASGCQGTTAPGDYCLGLKYVVYKDSTGTPYADRTLAQQDIDSVNSVWKQCGIAFQMEEYDAVDPGAYGLDPGAGALNQLTQIRTAFADSSRLALITTGSWGDGATAGWTALPGGPPYGAIVEASISTYPEIMAHELGHYLSLSHVPDDADLMNPVIYTTSSVLSSDQCASARASIPAFWSAMLR